MSDIRAAVLDFLSADESLVYFVQCNGNSGPIKIGISRSIESRMRGIQVACPYPLRLIGLMSGGALMEEALHKRFRHNHLRGEWFACSRDLMAFIRRLAQV